MHLIVEFVADFVIDYLVGFYFDAISRPLAATKQIWRV